MAESFFWNREAPCDPVYEKLCDPEVTEDAYEHLYRARLLTEKMWTVCREYVDQNAPSRARQDFNAVWWELYLAYSLRTAGVDLVPWRTRIRTKGIPDLVTMNPEVWLEAVMPGPGEKLDQLKEPPLGEVYTVPHDQFVLRLTAGIQEKAKVFNRYIADGTVQPSQPTVIAVSGGRLPFRFSEPPVPRIVRALLGVGNVGVWLDVKSTEIVGHFVEHRDHLFKNAGAEVRTDNFLSQEYAHISAVLYSAADCVNSNCTPGEDFVLVHNPNARVPVPDRWLRTGEQYRMESGGGIRRESATPHPIGAATDV